MEYTVQDVRNIRIKNGIAQKDFAELMGIPPGTWSNIELGNVHFYKNVRAKAIHLLRELGCDFTIEEEFPKHSHAVKSVVEEEPTPCVNNENDGDDRYNEPKTDVKVSDEEVNETISKNQIYRDVRSRMNRAQMTQVGYGLDKYPEPLNQDTWSKVETIDHIISETIDKLHYLTMLKIQLEEEGGND